MIVNRRTFVAKRGQLEEAVAMVLAEIKRTDTAPRVYVSETGMLDLIAIEWEMEGLKEYEEGWAEYFASPEAAPFMEKWTEITGPGGTNEIWRLVT